MTHKFSPEELKRLGIAPPKKGKRERFPAPAEPAVWCEDLWIAEAPGGVMLMSGYPHITGIGYLSRELVEKLQRRGEPVPLMAVEERET